MLVVKIKIVIVGHEFFFFKDIFLVSRKKRKVARNLYYQSQKKDSQIGFDLKCILIITIYILQLQSPLRKFDHEF